MIKGIHHTAISAGDLARSLRFYRDLLGLEVALEIGFEEGNDVFDRVMDLEGATGKLVLLKAGNAFVELFQFTSPEPQPMSPNRPVCDHGITHLCLEVVDIETEYERLKAGGMRFHCPPQDLGDLKVTYGRDPDGNVVELLEVSNPDSPVALS